MASWTVHLPSEDATDISQAERFVVVKDGLRPMAVLFGPLWLLVKRQWWGAAAALLIEGALFILAWQWALPRPALGALQGLFHLLLGLEASSLQRWGLRRRGWREIGALVAHGRAEAEARAAVLVVSLADARPTTTISSETARRYPLAAPPPSPVFGLFPEARPR
jgi:hypothetical protein